MCEEYLDVVFASWNLAKVLDFMVEQRARQDMKGVDLKKVYIHTDDARFSFGTIGKNSFKVWLLAQSLKLYSAALLGIKHKGCFSSLKADAKYFESVLFRFRRWTFLRIHARTNKRYSNILVHSCHPTTQLRHRIYTCNPQTTYALIFKWCATALSITLQKKGKK